MPLAATPTSAGFVSPSPITQFTRSLISSTSCRPRCIPLAASTLSPQSPRHPIPPTTSSSPLTAHLHPHPANPEKQQQQLSSADENDANESLASSSPESSKLTDVIIVPGKFDSFHVGHRKLAESASKWGRPTLISFSGMHIALGWQPKPPVIAPVEKDRILRQWSVSTGIPISLKLIPFTEVNEMTPEMFLSYIKQQFNAKGIVCGSDWRFGKKRVGDIDLLKRLAPKFDLHVTIVDAVIDKHENEIISSTRIRSALKAANISLVNSLLGRMHRVIGYTLYVDDYSVVCGDFVNMLPSPNRYSAIVRVIGRAEPIQTNVTVYMKQNEALIRVEDASRVFCINCEIYIDFQSKLDDT